MADNVTVDDVEYTPVCAMTREGSQFTVLLPVAEAVRSEREGGFTFIRCDPARMVPEPIITE